MQTNAFSSSAGFYKGYSSKGWLCELLREVSDDSCRNLIRRYLQPVVLCPRKLSIESTISEYPGEPLRYVSVIVLSHLDIIEDEGMDCAVQLPISNAFYAKQVIDIEYVFVSGGRSADAQKGTELLRYDLLAAVCKERDGVIELSDIEAHHVKVGRYEVVNTYVNFGLNRVSLDVGYDNMYPFAAIVLMFGSSGVSVGCCRIRGR